MNASVSIWDKLSRVVICLLFVAGLMGVFFWYLPLIKQNQKFRERILQLDTQIEHQERWGRQLRAMIDAAQNDPATVERMARERMGYARSGELIIKFEGPRTEVPRTGR